MSQINNFSEKSEMLRSAFFLKIKSVSIYGTQMGVLKAYINFEFDQTGDISYQDKHRNNWIKFMELTENPKLTSKFDKINYFEIKINFYAS